eukprot:716933-Hanusia_phi.AAC.1
MQCSAYDRKLRSFTSASSCILVRDQLKADVQQGEAYLSGSPPRWAALTAFNPWCSNENRSK